MKNLILLTLGILLTTNKLKADSPGCVVYHATFHLKSGLIFNGCFEINSYFEEGGLDEHGRNSFCNNRGLFELFKKKQQEKGWVEIYKKLLYVQPKSRQNKGPIHGYDGFVLSQDRVLLDSNDLIKIVFIRAETSKRLGRLNVDLIIGASAMLDTILYKKYWNQIFFSTDEENPGIISPDQYDNYGAGYLLYNYNPKISISELKRLARLKLPVDYKGFWEAFKKKHNYTEEQEWTMKLQQMRNEELFQQLLSVRQWFWESGIVLVVSHGGC